MPPKKKKDAGKKEDEVEVTQKPVVEEPKKEVKEVKEPASEVKPVEPKKEVQKPADNPVEQPKPVDSSQNRKINLAETEKLTEEQLMERRKMRFSLVGPEVSGVEAEEIAKKRMEKFGAIKPESKEDLEKRKQKFANPSAEDLSVLEKRKQKFSKSALQDDAAVLEERKKKFAVNPVNQGVSLDSEIEKDKSQRNKKRNMPQSHSKNHYDNNSKKFKR